MIRVHLVREGAHQAPAAAKPNRGIAGAHAGADPAGFAALLAAFATPPPPAGTVDAGAGLTRSADSASRRSGDSAAGRKPTAPVDLPDRTPVSGHVAGKPSVTGRPTLRGEDARNSNLSGLAGFGGAGAYSAHTVRSGPHVVANAVPGPGGENTTEPVSGTAAGADRTSHAASAACAESRVRPEAGAAATPATSSSPVRLAEEAVVRRDRAMAGLGAPATRSAAVVDTVQSAPPLQVSAKKPVGERGFEAAAAQGTARGNEMPADRGTSAAAGGSLLRPTHTLASHPGPDPTGNAPQASSPAGPGDQARPELSHIARIRTSAFDQGGGVSSKSRRDGRGQTGAIGGPDAVLTGGATGATVSAGRWEPTVADAGQAQPARGMPAPPETPVWWMSQRNSGQSLAGIVLQGVETGRDRIRVKVQPAGMGDIAISIQQHAGGLHVELQASQVQTASALAAETQQLTEALRAAGVDLADVRVSWSAAGGDSLSDSTSGGGSEQRQRPGSVTRLHARAAGVSTAGEPLAWLPEAVADPWGISRWQALNVRV